MAQILATPITLRFVFPEAQFMQEITCKLSTNNCTSMYKQKTSDTQKAKLESLYSQKWHSSCLCNTYVEKLAFFSATEMKIYRLF